MLSQMAMSLECMEFHFHILIFCHVIGILAFGRGAIEYSAEDNGVVPWFSKVFHVITTNGPFLDV
jgi:hypothetical protein